MEYPEVTPKNIWNFRQNNPELVVNDARIYLGLNEKQCDILRKILLARGVNKWFKVRRDLIAYKKLIKHQIVAVQNQRRMMPQLSKQLKPLHLTLSKIRSDLRAMCKTDRWQIWPKLGSHHKELKAMNTITASD